MEPTGIWYADREIPDGGTFVRGQLPNIQDGKEYSCVRAAGTALAVMALVAFAAFAAILLGL